MSLILNDQAIIQYIEMINRIKDYNNFLKIYETIAREEDRIFILMSIRNSFFKLESLPLVESAEDRKKIIASIKDECVVKGFNCLLTPSNENIIMYEGVLDPKIKIGVELESVGEKNQHFINFKQINDWQFKDDISLKNIGLEVCSPPMKYTVQNLRALKAHCEFLKANNFMINSNCGGHLHFDQKILSNPDAWLNFLTIFSLLEKDLYLLLNQADDNLRPNALIFAKPTTEICNKVVNYLIKYMDAPAIIFYGLIKSPQIESGLDRDHGINFLNLGNLNKDTIELRIPNGTLEFEELYLNILLIGALLSKCEELSNNVEKEISFYNELYSVLKNNYRRVELLLNLLFGNNQELKNMYIKRYNSHQYDPIIASMFKQRVDFAFKKEVIDQIGLYNFNKGFCKTNQ